MIKNQSLKGIREVSNGKFYNRPGSAVDRLLMTKISSVLGASIPLGEVSRERWESMGGPTDELHPLITKSSKTGLG